MLDLFGESGGGFRDSGLAIAWWVRISLRCMAGIGCIIDQIFGFFKPAPVEQLDMIDLKQYQCHSTAYIYSLISSHTERRVR